MALLDTTVLIDLARRPGSAMHERASRHLERIAAAGEALTTSRINEAEFRVGPERSANRLRALDRIEHVLALLEILEFDEDAAMAFAKIKAHLLNLGRPSGDSDTLIAAVAWSNDQTVVTRNPAHFSGIPGLRVESY